MPIPVTCPSCGRHIQAPDSLAGMQVTCKQCQSLFVVPAEAPGMDETAGINDTPAPTEAMAPSAPAVSETAAHRSAPTPQPAAPQSPAASPAASRPQPARESPSARSAKSASRSAPRAQPPGTTEADVIYYPCCVCELLCTAQEVYEDGPGQTICKKCFAARQGTENADEAPSEPEQTGAQAVPAPAPGAKGDELFCEGCHGLFPPDKLKLAPDGAVLCKKCFKARGRAA